MGTVTRDSPEQHFNSLLPHLTTARDKIFEMSGVLMQYHMHAPALVALWFQELNSCKDEKKRQALLYVMNDVIIKTSRTSDTRTEFLQAFSEVMDNVIACLVVGKNELLLEEVRKMVLVWEDSKNCIFAPQYTNHLKTKIMEAISTVLDEKSGAHVIQNFELTRTLRKIEVEHEALEPIAEKVEKLSHYAAHPRRMPSKPHSEPEKLKELRTHLQQYKEKCEKQLAERTAALLQLCKELQAQYQVYNSFVDREQELGLNIESKSMRDQPQDN